MWTRGFAHWFDIKGKDERESVDPERRRARQMNKVLTGFYKPKPNVLSEEIQNVYSFH